MFNWIWRRRAVAADVDTPVVRAQKPSMRAMTGKYKLLYEYLEHRYADTVVLTFAQIEDVVGFALPDQARREPAWWTHVDGPEAGPSYADAWRLASRTALPNLVAEIVTFDRAS